ncbi:ABC transporter permease [Candidatus Poseidoniales archaeon]|nr:ABC transporter permease [Candidatus Poseidoniales archaeon]MDC0183508.1 ABC transporter permease [Candidatus Poseidoniales archaeon]
MMESARSAWNSLPRGQRRLIISLAIMVDAWVGLRYGFGSLNLLDKVLSGGIPNDMVWLLQIVLAISGGFMLIKILFDDVPEHPIRSIGIACSPLFLLFIVYLTLDILFKGMSDDAIITLDLISISVGTLTWSTTYLAIAVGLTLTYKVQRYGNFAQSEFFMIGMYLSMVMVWVDQFYPLASAPRDGVLVWSLLLWTIIGAFVLTGIAGIVIDRLVYRGFRQKNASPQVMMIASLGIALILRALVYLRFGAGKKMFEPDADWRVPSLRWDIPTTKLRFYLGDRSIDEGSTYTLNSCDAEGGERIVVEGSKPLFETYDLATNCVDQATTGYAYYKGAMPVVIFTSVILLLILLNKTRLGRRMRAVADNPDLAASSGINVENVQMTSAFLSAGLSGMGGAIFAMTLRFTPETAFSLLLPSFAVIVLGTIGSIPGAIIGSLIVGFVRALSSPVLIGIGQPLGRSNYTALDGVMPYIFLIAILMIMPEGIGDAYEKWKVNRLRKRAEQVSAPNKKTGAVLAFLPTGMFGLHNMQQRKESRGQSMMIASIGAYVFHRLSNFIGANSFSEGACSQTCQDNEGVSSNLELVTGRSDGTLVITDSPFTEANIDSPPSDVAPYLHESWAAEHLQSMNEKWYDLMSGEMMLLDIISTLGDIIWPALPLLVWLVAIVEGVYLLQGRDDDPLRPIISKFEDATSSTGTGFSNLTISMKQLGTHLDSIPKKVGPIIDSLTDNLRRPFSRGEVDRSGGDHLAIYGRESPKGSWIMFGVFMFILLLFLAWLPVAEQDGMRFIKVLQVSNVLVTLSIFALMAFSLNLHTGVTGMVNFGVIFFVGIGSIVVGILSAPSELHGYDWPVIPATIVAILVAALAGWMLAYPTARLRMDYFAIVTISLGEIVRVLLAGEPLLRAGSWGSSIGISRYTLPGESWWFCGSDVPNKAPLAGLDATLGTADDIIQRMEPSDCREAVDLSSPAVSVGDLMNLGEPAPYMLLLAVIGILSTIFVWWLLDTILASPWGRILRAIREDEEVAQHHGHDVLTHKAASLALGAAIAGFAGALWAWKLTGFQPNHMMPARSTFLVWAAFIVGGAANNRGMVVGAFIIVLMEFVFNVLVAGQGSSDLPLHTTAGHIDSLFEWLVVDSWEVVNIFLVLALLGWLTNRAGLREVGFAGAVTFTFTGLMMGQRSIDETFSGGLQADMAYVKVLLIGFLILFSLKFNPKGLLPEVPSRPDRPQAAEAGGEGGDSSE